MSGLRDAPAVTDAVQSGEETHLELGTRPGLAVHSPLPADGAPATPGIFTQPVAR